MPWTIDTLAGKVCALGALLLGAAIAFLLCWGAAAASAAPLATRSVYATGRIVPIPASVPHEPGDMVDRRIVPDLRWIAARYPIYITDGYSGPLPNGVHVGCNRCHVRNSDHYNGLAVDIVPLGGGTRCDASWRPIDRLARWAEPRRNRPRPPFRWVGYDGDPGHGCGNHLHLSWEHAAAPMFRLAEWVEVFTVGRQEVAGQPSQPSPEPPQSSGPSGGISTVQAGGVSPHGD
jgi:hypothetical protein